VESGKLRIASTERATMRPMWLFAKQLVWMAADSSVSAMSTSWLALTSGVLGFLLTLYVRARKHGFHRTGVKKFRKEWRENTKYTVFFLVAWWALLFVYCLLIRVPREITAQANSAKQPSIQTSMPAPSLAAITLGDKLALMTYALSRSRPSDFAVWTVNGNSYSFELGQELCSVFKGAKWTTSGKCPVNGQFLSGVEGIWITVHSQGNRMAAKLKFELWDKARLRSRIDVRPSAPPDRIMVTVGQTPNMTQTVMPIMTEMVGGH
jgi:hypothetical protein